MKTITNLVLALSLLSISNSGAITIVGSVSQELYALAYACNGAECVDDGPYTVDGPLPSSLSDSAYAATSGGDTVASCSVSQSIVLSGLEFQSSGTVSVHQEGIYPLGYGSAYCNIDFHVTGQVETITVDLSGLSLVNDDYGFSIILYTWGQYPNSQLWQLTTPQTLQIPVAPGNYTLSVGAIIPYTDYVTIDRSVSFSDTIGFTNFVRASNYGTHHGVRQP